MVIHFGHFMIGHSLVLYASQAQRQTWLDCLEEGEARMVAVGALGERERKTLGFVKSGGTRRGLTKLHTKKDRALTKCPTSFWWNTCFVTMADS